MAFDPTATLQNTTNFAEAMKIYYAAKAVQTLNREVVLLGELEKTKEYWTGKQHQVPVHMRSSESVGARGEDATLPESRALTYAESIVANKSLYCSVKVTGQADAQTRDQAGAWASVKEDQIRNAVMDLRYDLGRQAYGDSKGILCEVKDIPSTSGDDSTVTILSEDAGDSPTNFTGWAWNTTKCLRPGMWVAWGQYDAGTEGAGPPKTGFSAPAPVGTGYGYIKSVSDSSPYNEFVVSKVGGAAPVATDVFVRGDANTAGTHSFGQEVMGLTGLVGTGALQGIDPAADYPEWKASVLSNGGTKRPLDEVLFQQALNRITDRTNGNTEFAVAHTSVRDSFLFHIKSLGRERYAPQKLVAGWSVLEYAGGAKPVRVYADRQARHGKLWGIDPSSMKCFIVKAFQWDESNGTVWKWEKGKDAMVAFGKLYKNFGVTDRKRNFVIEDIAVDEGSLYE